MCEEEEERERTVVSSCPQSFTAEVLKGEREGERECLEAEIDESQPARG